MVPSTLPDPYAPERFHRSLERSLRRRAAAESARRRRRRQVPATGALVLAAAFAGAPGAGLAAATPAGAGSNAATTQATGWYRIGSTGPGVAELQRSVGVAADGVFGPVTDSAVRSYQARNGLLVDGIAGPQTLGSLGLGGRSTVGASTGTPTASATEASQDVRSTRALSGSASSRAVATGFERSSSPPAAGGRGTPSSSSSTGSEASAAAARAAARAQSGATGRVEATAPRAQATGAQSRVSAGASAERESQAAEQARGARIVEQAREAEQARAAEQAQAAEQARAAEQVREAQSERASARSSTGTGSTGATSGSSGSSGTSSSGSGSSARSRGTSGSNATLERIAQCESGGNASAVGPGGYGGKYQFDPATWRSLGGTGDPASAPVSEQDRIAGKLYAQQGSSPWANCAR